MKLAKEEKDRLEEIYQYFLNDPRVMRMKAVPMHRGSNCYEHSFKVAKKAIKHGLRRINKEKIDLEVILVGAILHDYYLYDWRSDRSKRKKHCHNHPDIAVANAVKDFAISKKVQRVIETHMWPIKFKDYPNSKEARIVSVSDKMVTIGEAFTSIKYKQKKREEFLSYISKLFDD